MSIYRKPVAAEDGKSQDACDPLVGQSTDLRSLSRLPRSQLGCGGSSSTSGRAQACDWITTPIYALRPSSRPFGHTWRAHGRSLAYLSGTSSCSSRVASTLPPGLLSEIHRPRAGRWCTHAAGRHCPLNTPARGLTYRASVNSVRWRIQVARKRSGVCCDRCIGALGSSLQTRPQMREVLSSTPSRVCTATPDGCSSLRHGCEKRSRPIACTPVASTRHNR